VRVYIADDHAIVRSGVRAVVESQPGWLICGEAADGHTALAQATQLRPDVAVLDVDLPAMDGVLVTKLLRAASPETEVLLFSAMDDEATVERGLAAGARGYLLRSEANERLIDAINALALGQPYLTAVASELLLKTASRSRPMKPRLGSLTTRQSQVAELIARGKSNKEIGRELRLSVKTVENHRTSAMRRAGVHSVADLVQFITKAAP
jgi:DNA-binding NarL/FixJ family response regulator